MKLTIIRDDGSTSAEEMEEIYRHRHEVFVERLGWEAIRKADGIEKDQFDSPDAIHLVVRDKDGKIAAYTRLLPSTGPNLLTDAYPQIMRGNEVPNAPDIFEWTRSSGLPRPSEGDFVYNEATKVLYLGIMEYCLEVGISSLLVEFQPFVLTIMMEIGYDVIPLAEPSEIHGVVVVPVIGHLHDESLEICRELFGIERSVLPAEVPGIHAPSTPEIEPSHA